MPAATVGPARRVGGRARRAVLASLLALAVGACGGPGPGSGPGPAAGDAPTTPAQPPVRIMIVGDSTAQESAGDYTWRYRLAQHLALSAPGRVDLVGTRTGVWDNVADVDNSPDYADPHFDSDHHSVWGLAIHTAIPHIEQALRDHPADIMLVLMGGNDLAYWSGPAETALVMKQFIDTARLAAPGLTFIIGHVLYGGVRRELADAFNVILDRSVADWSTPGSRVAIAQTDRGWDPFFHTWDGAHPNPDGEFIIARAFADALADLGVGGRFGPILGGVPWPGTGQQPVVTPLGPAQVQLAWAQTPGATQYFVEQRVISTGETDFTRLPGAVAGYQWTSGPLPAGATVSYRVVPVKGVMVGQPGPQTTITLEAAVG
ncbi:MAG: GDSL family lipase [Frankia sp.]|nr:GDSL family lipase [Frankia sp.]